MQSDNLPSRSDMRSPRDRLVVMLATGFGLGLSPVASGTTGTPLGLPLAWALAGAPLAAQIWVAAVLSLAAVPICDRAERLLGRKDDGRIVADEYMTFLVCTVGLPLHEAPWLLAAAFVVNRLFDILKPPPAYRWQRMRGGVGIVIDDVVAAIYALGVNHLLFRGVSAYLA